MKAFNAQTPFIRFLILASIGYLALFIIYQFIVKRYTLYDQAFIGSIVRSAAFCLNTLGYKTFMVLQDRDMQVVGIDGSNGVWVGSNCNAITLFALFSVFIIAYPGNKTHKLWYVPSGIILIHLLNILRVTALAVIANYWPQWLDFNHTYTFTFLIYLFIFLLWIFWINKFAGKSAVK